MRKSVQIRVKGIVQGVGFRPFIYMQADKYRLKGIVKNDTEGVLIKVEGDDSKITALIDEIRNSPPPLSKVSSLESVETPHFGYNEFSITSSEELEKRFTFLPPDTAVCNDCLSEFFDKNDKRFSYPFITCTNCGPRFSIIKNIPYDRKNTSMDLFKMCPQCRNEYEDPHNRRFHTQPNACDDCGPHQTLYRNDGSIITDDIEDVIAKAIEYFLDGKIIALKGVGGFLLACDATNDDAVIELRSRKVRPFKPFAIMSGTIEKAEEFLHITTEERDLLLSKERPIVLLKEKRAYVSRHIAPSISFHGLMLPYQPFQYQLFSNSADLVLVMTSGNISDEPIIYKDDDALKYLNRIADYFIMYDRDIQTHCDDSILFVNNERPYFIRRARGYVPIPFHTTNSKKQILAAGGDLKNCFAILKDDVVIMSQYLGDLASPMGNQLYRKIIDHFCTVYDFSPDIIVSDMHPQYFTGYFADELEEEGLVRIKVQHHHAHIASVIEEFGIDGEVIGISFDGTGYGLDGTLWGSEFIIADREKFTRAAHFSNFYLPGGENAIKDVWKIGVALLYDRFGTNIPLMEKDSQIELLFEIMEKGINSPLTCSIGRLFDGISSLLGISRSISTEAEAAMHLEESAIKGTPPNQPFEIPCVENGAIIAQTGALTEYIVELIKKGKSKENIAYAFHSSIAYSSLRIIETLREKYGINRVALSGGVFQNRLLLTLIKRGLEEKGFDIYLPGSVPFNDGCIALGQLTVAKEILKNGQFAG